jgi:long-chain acyl-CoA synthetase
MAPLLKIAPKCPKLRVVVSIDLLGQSREDSVRDELKKHDIRFMTLAERESTFRLSTLFLTRHLVEASGKATSLPPRPPTAESVATICYSSGTTSNPKGVVLTHWNLTSSAMAFSQGFTFASPEPNLALISYLPLAHIVGRIVEYTAFLLGLRIGYYSGDPLRLIEDCQILRPSVFPAVPRILNRIAMRMQAVKAEASLKGV